LGDTEGDFSFRFIFFLSKGGLGYSITDCDIQYDNPLPSEKNGRGILWGLLENANVRAGLAPALTNILFQRATARVAPTKIE